MSRIVEDGELKTLRAMAEGARPFKELSEWEEVAALDFAELRKLPARERLAVGYYVLARSRAASSEDVT